MGLFKRGYEAVHEEKERQDKIRENSGKKLFDFFLSPPKGGENSEADLRFLTEEPVTFQRHTVKMTQSGKEHYENYTCEGKDCPLCAEGNKPSFAGAYLVIDKRPFEYTNKDGKKVKGDKQVRMFVYGNRVLSQLDRISGKYGLTSREITMVRLGSGTDTTYTFERGDERLKPISSEELEKLLPEKLKDEYDGTVDSIYSIVENQLVMRTRSYNAEDEAFNDSSSDDEEPEDNNEIVGVDDEELPFKPTNTKAKSLFKKPSPSMKPRTSAKSLLKKSSK